jgi:UDP-GlcNAc:undecaprenyl-phosphate GlcNAc-1-phosphate transferase
LAVIAIRLNLNSVSQPVSLASKLLVLALPIIDTTTVVISRLRRGVSPLTGGRDHLSHRVAKLLESRGASGTKLTQNSVLALGLVSVAVSVIAVGIAG